MTIRRLATFSLLLLVACRKESNAPAEPATGAPSPPTTGLAARPPDDAKQPDDGRRFQEHPAGHSGFTAIVARSDGSWIASGTSSPAGGAEPRWFVATSVDAGTRWTVEDTVRSEAGEEGSCSSLLETPTGALVGAGFVVTNGHRQWVVRRRERGGQWTTVDRIPAAPPEEGEAFRSVASADGTLFVAGTLGTGNDQAWVVRRSSDDGRTWSTIDRSPAGQDARPTSILARGRSVVVVGTRRSETGPVWAGRRSTDGGTTWSNIVLPSIAGTPVALRESGGGFVVAGTTPGAGRPGIGLFQSSDGGSTFVPLETPTHAAPLVARDFAATGTTLVLLAQEGPEGGGDWILLTREGKAWREHARTRPGFTGRSEARALTIGAAGDVIVVGYETGEAGTMRAVTQRVARLATAP